MESISGSVVPLGMYICQNKARIRWKSPNKIENKAHLTNVIGDLCEEENQISTGDDKIKLKNRKFIFYVEEGREICERKRPVS